jgi:hypothetical protein
MYIYTYIYIYVCIYMYIFLDIDVIWNYFVKLGVRIRLTMYLPN